MSKTALITGATGLVGGFLLDFILASPHYEKVKVLTRRTTALKHKKLEEIIIDFEQMPEVAAKLAADDVYCTLGITRKKAGSLANARLVEYDYPLMLAKIALAQKAKQFLMVTSVGANPEASNYYFKTKGELEQALKTLNFPSLKIFRPSLLLGPREEIRIGEDISKVFSIAFSMFIPARYQGIQARTVAKFMELTAKKEEEGFKVYESEVIRRIEKRVFDMNELQEKTLYKGEN